MIGEPLSHCPMYWVLGSIKHKHSRQQLGMIPSRNDWAGPLSCSGGELELLHVLWDILCSGSSPGPRLLWVVGCRGGVSGVVGMVVMMVVVGVVIGRGGGGAEGGEDSGVGEVRRGGICRGSAEGRPRP